MRKLAMMTMLVAAGCTTGGVDGSLQGKKKEPPPPPCTSCWVTGGGQIDAEGGGGSFGGNAKSFRDGFVEGEWNHVTFAGDRFHGDPEWIECAMVAGPGPGRPAADANYVTFGGQGTWNGEDCVEFRVEIEDHGEPGVQDTYSITIWECGGDPVTDLVYAASDVRWHGNLQIHPPNPGHPSTCEAPGSFNRGNATRGGR